MNEEDSSLLTTLCAICHINTPKYRCPRCSTRTCSLPCTRRHKLWSECSGIRDPAAYLRRNELATESAFDRDFNFITGIERRIERAGREAENRGVDVEGRFVGELGVVGLEKDDLQRDGDEGKKRKGGAGAGARPETGLVKGEAGFLRRATDAGVRVIKAPRGMSRGKTNGSKWHPRQKCLHWTIEWITDAGKKTLNCAETCTIAEAYDRAFPLSKEERELRNQQTVQNDEQKEETTQAESEPSASEPTPLPATTIPSTTSADEETPIANPQEAAPEASENDITPHRTLFFYIHRPRTATKQPILVPVSSKTKLTNALRGRTVLEFPTIYALPINLVEQSEDSKYTLEKEYLRTHSDAEAEGEAMLDEVDAAPLFGAGAVDIEGVDEEKVLEVLKQDLLAAPEAEVPL